MNQFNIIKIYIIFTKQEDTNSIQVCIDYKPGKHWNISRDIKQSAEILWSNDYFLIFFDF